MTFVAASSSGAGWWDEAEVLRLRAQGGGTPQNVVFAHALSSVGADASEDGTGRGTPLVASALDTKLGDKQWLEDQSVGKFLEMAKAGAGVRRLTPTECEALQALPRGWTAPEGVKCPDSRRYAALGDAVTASVAEWIGRRILARVEVMRPHDGE